MLAVTRADLTLTSASSLVGIQTIKKHALIVILMIMLRRHDDGRPCSPPRLPHVFPLPTVFVAHVLLFIIVNVFSFCNGSAPSVGKCTTKMKTCQTWRRQLRTCEDSAWRRNLPVTVTTRTSFTWWRVKVIGLQATSFHCIYCSISYDKKLPSRPA